MFRGLQTVTIRGVASKTLQYTRDFHTAKFRNKNEYSKNKQEGQRLLDLTVEYGKDVGLDKLNAYKAEVIGGEHIRTVGKFPDPRPHLTVEAFDKSGKQLYFEDNKTKMVISRIHIPTDKKEWVGESYKALTLEEYEAATDKDKKGGKKGGGHEGEAGHEEGKHDGGHVEPKHGGGHVEPKHGGHVEPKHAGGHEEPKPKHAGGHDEPKHTGGHIPTIPHKGGHGPVVIPHEGDGESKPKEGHGETKPKEGHHIPTTTHGGKHGI